MPFPLRLVFILNVSGSKNGGFKIKTVGGAVITPDSILVDVIFPVAYHKASHVPLCKEIIASALPTLYQYCGEENEECFNAD